GISTVDLRYEGTPIQHIADLISLVTAAVLLIFSIIWRFRAPLAPQEQPIQPRSSSRPNYVPPFPWLLPMALIFLVILKGAWLDPKTTLLRRASTCDAIWGASAQANATFAGNIRLCGYTISSPTLHPGDTLHLILYWQLAYPISDGLGTFVHLLGTAFNPATNNPLWGQQDKQNPGWLPLPNWVPNKLYQDVYDF